MNTDLLTLVRHRRNQAARHCRRGARRRRRRRAFRRAYPGGIADLRQRTDEGWQLQHRTRLWPARRCGRSGGLCPAGDLSEAALKRAADAVRAVTSGYAGSMRAAPQRTNTVLYGDENPIGAARASRIRRSCCRRSTAYLRNKDGEVRQVTASIAASWQGGRYPACRRSPRSRHQADDAHQHLGDGGRRRPAGIRFVRHRRPRWFRRFHHARSRQPWRRRGFAPGAGQSRQRSMRRPARWMIVLGSGMAGRRCTRGGRPRA